MSDVRDHILSGDMAVYSSLSLFKKLKDLKISSSWWMIEDVVGKF